ncbi:MAG TPA: hypothetical protein PLH80_06355 [Spirochaetota bacterium]|nr:hypothetical protein [Spirochaetota bacterium]HPK45021.1 hypothetical protein [Spirochaetota bacterium]HQG42724.1 hypothetical protein [Spirochaetota bacterium]HQI38164.1 hypothetical protein [Spirochaetota bacterium]
MVKKIISILLVTFVFTSCYKKPMLYELPGPELKDIIKVEIHIANECPDNAFNKPIEMSGNRIYNICKEPIITDEDIKSIKLMKYYPMKEEKEFLKSLEITIRESNKNNENEVSYRLWILFTNPDKLFELTKQLGQTWVFYVNNHLNRAINMQVTIEQGILYFGDFSKDAIIKMIGKERFEEYQRIWAEQLKLKGQQ